MANHPAIVRLDADHAVGPISPFLFGGFAEHMGRCIYGGIYDPGSPLADELGFRTDVISAIRELGVPILRYPGGNFVCTYDWKDGIGPKEKRPVRRELAWRQIEPNRFGLDEFIDYCRKIPCEAMLSANLSTAELRSLSDLVEYCNAPAGTYWADRRVANGHAQPHDVRYWCLGNEVDGPWQIGQTDAITYGHLAREAAKIIKRHDRQNQTILCGSSTPSLPTYPAWDQTILDICWDDADFIAMHHYATNDDNDTPSYLAYAISLQEHIDTIARIIRTTRARRQSQHNVKIAWDEWNVWYKNRTMDAQWKCAAPLCEETYNLEDALVVAQWLNLFLRRCDVLGIACLAQVVNVIAPLKTTPMGMLKESTFYPLALFSKHARGISLNLTVTSPTYSTARYGDVPMLDGSATFDREAGRLSVFVVNRSTSDVLPVEIKLDGCEIDQFDCNAQLAGRDPKAFNTFDKPSAVVPQTLGPIKVTDATARLVLPPLSFTVLNGPAR